MGGDEVRLLLVDDDPAVLRAYAANLGRHGAEVEIASSGGEAIERLKVRTYDAIVSDISRPEMTGIDFLKAVRAHDLDVPVILMTGQHDLESAIRAVEFGAFRYPTLFCRRLLGAPSRSCIEGARQPAAAKKPRARVANIYRMS